MSRSGIFQIRKGEFFMGDKAGKLQELLRNEDFVKELLTKEDPEDVQALFEDSGLELSMDEVRAIGDVFDRAANGEITAEQIEKAANGELSEEELSQVAGGEVIIGVGTVIAICVIGVLGLEGSYLISENWDRVKRWFRRW